MQFTTLGGSQSVEEAGSGDADFEKVLAQGKHFRVGGDPAQGGMLGRGSKPRVSEGWLLQGEFQSWGREKPCRRWVMGLEGVLVSGKHSGEVSAPRSQAGQRLLT